MDKAEFLEKAPDYYVLVIAAFFWKKGDAKTIGQIFEGMGLSPTMAHPQVLLEVATQKLVDDGLISVLRDTFGPPMYKPTKALRPWVAEQAKTPASIVAKFNNMDSSTAWLQSALQSVANHYSDLEVTREDFDAKSLEIEWEPIPIDRGSPKFKRAEEDLDSAIEAIQGDNGYAVHHSAEQHYTLAQLKRFREMVKTEAQIVLLQVKTFAIDPLTRVAKRLGDAATGVAAAAARQAIIAWLRSVIGKAADWMF